MVKRKKMWRAEGEMVVRVKVVDKCVCFVL